MDPQQQAHNSSLWMFQDKKVQQADIPLRSFYNSDSFEDEISQKHRHYNLAMKATSKLTNVRDDVTYIYNIDQSPGGFRYEQDCEECNSKQKRIAAVFPSRFLSKKRSGLDVSVSNHDFSGSPNGVNHSPIHRGCFSMLRAPRWSKTLHRNQKKKTATKQSNHQRRKDDCSEFRNFTLLSRNEANSDVPRLVDMKQLPNYILRLSDNRSRTTHKTQSEECKSKFSATISCCREGVPNLCSNSAHQPPVRHYENDYSANIFDLSPIRERPSMKIPSHTSLIPTTTLDDSEPGPRPNAYQNKFNSEHIQRQPTAYGDFQSEFSTSNAVNLSDSTSERRNVSYYRQNSAMNIRIGRERLSRRRCHKLVNNLLRAKRYFLRVDDSGTIMRTLAVL